MDFNENIKKALKQQQEIFEATYKSTLIAQGHVEQLTTSVLEQAKVPVEGLEIYKNALTECNKNRDTIKKNIDDNYDSLQTFLK